MRLHDAVGAQAGRAARRRRADRARGAPFAPQMLGGGQQKGLRAGTENLSGIAGFGAAAKAVLARWRRTRPHRRICAIVSRTTLKAAIPGRGDLRRKRRAPVQHLQFRAAGPVGREYRHRAGSGRRAGQFRLVLFLGQDHAFACAVGDGRGRRSGGRFACASASAGIPRMPTPMPWSHRWSRFTTAPARARREASHVIRCTETKEHRRRAGREVQIRLRHRYRDGDARPRACPKTRCATSPPRRASRNGCWNGGWPPSAAGAR